MVTEIKSKSQKPCKFPFIHNGETYTGCTNIIGRRRTGEVRFGNPWCSTNTTPQNRHVSGGGFYGDCPKTPECPLAIDGKLY